MLNATDIDVMAKAAFAEEQIRIKKVLKWEELSDAQKLPWRGLIIAAVRAVGIKVIDV